MNIEEIRKNIDAVDQQLVALYEQRMALAGEIAQEKLHHNLPIEDAQREEQLLRNRCALLKDATLAPGLRSMFSELMRVSKRHQHNQIRSGQAQYINNFLAGLVRCESLDAGKVGYSGIPGSYAEQAANEFFKGAELIGLNGFEEVFKALSRGDMDYGVLPIENSSTGGIIEVYDLLRKYGTYIVGEHKIHVEHCLLAKKGTQLNDIKKVYSHQEGLMQCREFLGGHPTWEREAMVNTAVSAKAVSQMPQGDVAAIASQRAAQLYDMDILASHINFNSKNYTRFIVVSSKQLLLRDANKISMYISLPHVSGSLASLLGVFSDFGINMVKVESRPIYNKTWEYYFYIDIEGDIEKANTMDALRRVEEHAEYMELLGAYKGAQQ